MSGEEWGREKTGARTAAGGGRNGQDRAAGKARGAGVGRGAWGVGLEPWAWGLGHGPWGLSEDLQESPPEEDHLR